MRLKYAIFASIAIICIATTVLVFNLIQVPTESPNESDTAPTISIDANDAPEEVLETKDASPVAEDVNIADIKIENKNKEEKTPSKELEEAVQNSVQEKISTCILSIRCDAIFKSERKPSPEKLALLPSDGIILSESTVEIKDGDTVFDVLLRETKSRKIHLEFQNTPMYNSSYIEGISNLYEFDCGELSGWLFSVNGEFYGQGSSSHVLKDGDIVSWVYSCDLGRDVGGYVSEAQYEK